MGRLTFKRDPAALAALEREATILTRQRGALRAALGAVSPAYRDLRDRAARARRDKADEETYASIYTSLVKAQVTDDNIRTLNEGMNAYGGIGFMAETPVSQRLKDSQVLCIWEGTNDIQALNTVGRQIAPDNTDSRGRVVFERLIADIRQFIETHRRHPAVAESVAHLAESVRPELAADLDVLDEADRPQRPSRALAPHATRPLHAARLSPTRPESKSGSSQIGALGG